MLFSQPEDFPRQHCSPLLVDSQQTAKPFRKSPSYDYPKCLPSLSLSPEVTDLDVVLGDEEKSPESHHSLGHYVEPESKEKLVSELDIDLMEMSQEIKATDTFTHESDDYMLQEANRQLDAFRDFGAKTCIAGDYLMTRYQDMKQGDLGRFSKSTENENFNYGMSSHFEEYPAEKFERWSKEFEKLSKEVRCRSVFFLVYLNWFLK